MIIPERCNGQCDTATQTLGNPASGNGQPCTCKCPTGAWGRRTDLPFIPVGSELLQMYDCPDCGPKLRRLTAAD